MTDQISGGRFVLDQVPKYLSEFIGTFFLVFTVGNNVLGKLTVWGVTSIACSLMVSIYALGAASGAHFNPAVTIAVFLTGKLPGGIKEACYYVGSQFLGGCFAAWIYIHINHASFDLTPGDNYSIWQAIVVEFLYTCMLCFTVLNVACTSSAQGNQYFGLAIGFVIIAGGYAVGGISGAAFNPAVSVAIDASSMISKGFGYCVAYVMAEVVGSCLAVVLFRVVRPEEFGSLAAKNSLSARLSAEMIGTYFLALTVAFNVSEGVVATAFSIGSALLCMVYALGNCSGGHFNPAVTVALLLSRRNKIDLAETSLYIGSQLFGGILGCLTVAAVLGRTNPLNPGKTWAESWSSTRRC